MSKRITRFWEHGVLCGSMELVAVSPILVAVIFWTARQHWCAHDSRFLHPHGLRQFHCCPSWHDVLMCEYLSDSSGASDVYPLTTGCSRRLVSRCGCVCKSRRRSLSRTSNILSTLSLLEYTDVTVMTLDEAPQDICHRNLSARTDHLHIDGISANR